MPKSISSKFQDPIWSITRVYIFTLPSFSAEFQTLEKVNYLNFWEESRGQTVLLSSGEYSFSYHSISANLELENRVNGGREEEGGSSELWARLSESLTRLFIRLFHFLFLYGLGAS